MPAMKDMIDTVICGEKKKSATKREREAYSKYGTWDTRTGKICI